MTEIVSLTAGDGHVLDAMVAAPAGAPRGGLVVIQEIFGLNDHMDRLCASFAEAGYAVCAPALFDRLGKNITFGYFGDDYQAARDERSKLTDEWILTDVAAAKDHLKPAGKVGLVGYCFGGYVAWMAGTEFADLACSISCYGGGIVKKLDRVPRCAMQFHIGDRDYAVPLNDIQAVKDAYPDIPVYVYDGAGHGFCTDDREGFFDPRACARATGRILDFLGHHVG